MNDTTNEVRVSAKAKLDELKRLRKDVDGLGLSVFASKLFVKQYIDPICKVDQWGEFDNEDFAELANIIETYLYFDTKALTDGLQMIGHSLIEQNDCGLFLESCKDRSDFGFFIEQLAKLLSINNSAYLNLSVSMAWFIEKGYKKGGAQ